MSYDDPAPAADVFQVVTRDEDSGDIVAKVVNVSAVTQRTQVEVSDAEIAPTGRSRRSSRRPGATNTKAAPEHGRAGHARARRAVVVVHVRPAAVLGHVPDAAHGAGGHDGADGRLAPRLPRPVGDWRAAPATVVATASDDRAVASLETSVDGGAWTASPTRRPSPCRSTATASTPSRSARRTRPATSPRSGRSRSGSTRSPRRRRRAWTPSGGSRSRAPTRARGWTGSSTGSAPGRGRPTPAGAGRRRGHGGRAPGGRPGRERRRDDEHGGAGRERRPLDDVGRDRAARSGAPRRPRRRHGPGRQGRGPDR